MQQIQVGETLSKSFRVFFQGFPTLLAIALPIYTPYIAIEIISPGEIDDLTGIRADNPIGTALGFLLGPFVTAACTYEVLQRLRGERAGVAECLLVGLRRLFPVLAVSLLVWIAICLGVIALIVGSIFMAVTLSVAVPVCVVERPGILKSLERSFELTKGSRWAIFAILLIYGLIGIMAPGIVGGIGAVATLSGSEGFADILHWILIAMTVVLAAMNSVFAATVYHDLRTKKEGAQSDELVQVFA